MNEKIRTNSEVIRKDLCGPDINKKNFYTQICLLGIYATAQVHATRMEEEGVGCFSSEEVAKEFPFIIYFIINILGEQKAKIEAYEKLKEQLGEPHVGEELVTSITQTITSLRDLVGVLELSDGPCEECIIDDDLQCVVCLTPAPSSETSLEYLEDESLPEVPSVEEWIKGNYQPTALSQDIIKRGIYTSMHRISEGVRLSSAGVYKFSEEELIKASLEFFEEHALLIARALGRMARINLTMNTLIEKGERCVKHNFAPSPFNGMSACAHCFEPEVEG